MNKVILVGRVGQAPESRDVNGQTVVNFSIATSKSYKDKTTGERKEQTTWHRCEAWGGIATTIKSYVKKGQQLFIEGEIRNNKKDDITYTTIRVNSFEFGANPRTSDAEAMAAQPAAVPEPNTPQEAEDDLPF